MQMPKRLVRALAAAGAVLMLALTPSLGAGYPNARLLVSAGGLAGMLARDDVRVIDVRPRKDYEVGHIPGALHLGADDVIDRTAQVDGVLLPEARLAEMLSERGIDKSVQAVLYDDKGGFHAARLFWMLEYFGHRRVAILDGGVPRWTAEGRKLDRETPKVRRRAFTPTLTERRAASADWILERRDDKTVTVVDVRPAKMYANGHIPWAISIPWAENLAADGTMKPAEALRAHFAAHGVTPENNIAVHCQDGKAASHSYFTLRLLGYPRVRTYDRS